MLPALEIITVTIQMPRSEIVVAAVLIVVGLIGVRLLVRFIPTIGG